MASFSRTVLLPQSPEAVWREVQNPALMVHVARGMMGMRLSGGKAWPSAWEPGEHRVDLRFLGFLPVGWQMISVHLLPEEGGVYRAEDRGYSPFIRRWHHVIEVAPDGQEATRYTDRLEVDAGLLTPFVALFARVFFAHRQRRLSRLAARGFDYARAG